MLSRVFSAAVNGIEAYPVEVEVDAGYGDTRVVMLVNNTPKTLPIEKLSDFEWKRQEGVLIFWHEKGTSRPLLIGQTPPAGAIFPNASA